MPHDTAPHDTAPDDTGPAAPQPSTRPHAEAAAVPHRRAADAPAVETDLGIVDGLAQLSYIVQAVIGQVGTEYGLSTVQLRLLGVLRDREPGMQELARHLGLDKSSMTGLVDRAERRGLVRRAPSPHDRRAVQVSLTEHGRRTALASTAAADRRIRALTAELTDGQRSQLSRLVSLLLSRLAPVALPPR